MLETKYKGYFVDELGNVYSNRKNGQLRQLKPWLNKNGYYMVDIYSDKRHKVSVHRLICDTLVRPLDDGDIINHKDGDKLNNKLSNLEITTYSGNNSHAYENDLNKGTVRIPDEDLIDMIYRFQCGERQVDICKSYGLQRTYLVEILKGNVRRNIWKVIDANHPEITFRPNGKAIKRFNKVDDDTLIEMIKLVQDGNSMRSVSLQYGCGEEFMGKVMRKESRAYIWDKI